MMHPTKIPEDLPLITKSRSEKLSILTHLIVNSNQPILLLAPKGVGKSKLIEVLVERKKNAWHCLLISADEESSSENIIEMISDFRGKEIAKPFTNSDEPLDCHDKVLIIIDNVGLLPPGEMAFIIEHVLADPTLRLILAMTPDQFFVKNRTDNIVDDCYVIELPTLTKNECGDFLRVLATQSKFRLPINLISDHIIETVYQDSHGIPGHIVCNLPQWVKAKKFDYASWILFGSAVVLVAIAMILQWLSANGQLSI